MKTTPCRACQQPVADGRVEVSMDVWEDDAPTPIKYEFCSLRCTVRYLNAVNAMHELAEDVIELEELGIAERGSWREEFKRVTGDTDKIMGVLHGKKKRKPSA